MMWNNYFSMFSSTYGMGTLPFFMPFLIAPLIVWSLAWKGLALWKAARRGEMYWFVALLIVNTLGILEILYLYVFSTEPPKNGSSNQPAAPAS